MPRIVASRKLAWFVPIALIGLAALWAWPHLRLDPKTRALAAELRDHAGMLVVAIDVQPQNRDLPAPDFPLRTVTLHVPAEVPGVREAVGPDGEPVKASARIGVDEASALVERLAQEGALDRARSEFTDRDDRHARITVSYSGKSEHGRYFIDYDWGPELVDVLKGLHGALRGDAAERLGRLIRELDPTYAPRREAGDAPPGAPE